MTSMRGSADKLSQSTFGRRIPVITTGQYSRADPASKDDKRDPWKQGQIPKRGRVIGVEVTGRRKPNVRAQLQFVRDATLRLLATPEPREFGQQESSWRWEWKVELNEACR